MSIIRQRFAIALGNHEKIGKGIGLFLVIVTHPLTQEKISTMCNILFHALVTPIYQNHMDDSALDCLLWDTRDELKEFFGESARVVFQEHVSRYPISSIVRNINRLRSDTLDIALVADAEGEDNEWILVNQSESTNKIMEMFTRVGVY